jgi:hypothetical protein
VSTPSEQHRSVVVDNVRDIHRYDRTGSHVAISSSRCVNVTTNERTNIRNERTRSGSAEHISLIGRVTQVLDGCRTLHYFVCLVMDVDVLRSSIEIILSRRLPMSSVRDVPQTVPCRVMHRCYLTVVCLSGCALLISVAYLLTWTPNRPVVFAVREQTWKLSSRHEQRMRRLDDQYRSLVNLSALKTNPRSTRTMIYSCQSFCGGWGDRLRGILSVYILALLSERHFMIDMTYPCDLFQVVRLNAINWTHVHPSSSQRNRTRLTINTMASWQTAYRQQISKTIESTDFVQTWSSYDDVYLSTNSDYMTLALVNPHMSNRSRMLLDRLPASHATMQRLFPLLFELLFRPSGLVEQKVDMILGSVYRQHLICLHVRIGKNPTNPYDHAFVNRANVTRTMIDFTDNYRRNRSSSIVFITSDSGEAVSHVLQHYRRSSMTIVGPILHIDRFDRQSSMLCDGFVKVLADFYVLGECQTSLLSNSGFSSWANRRRQQPNENLYVYDERSKQLRKA